MFMYELLCDEQWYEQKKKKKLKKMSNTKIRTTNECSDNTTFQFVRLYFGS